MTPSHSTPPRRARASAATLAAAVLIAAALAACGGSSSSSTSTTATSAGTTSNASVTKAGGFTTAVFANGVPIQFSTSKGKVSVTQPDDITNIGSNIFVGFQNGVGTMGETMNGVKDSTVVEFSSSGSKMAQWQIAGHVDGLTADPSTGKVVATCNEDGNAQLYVIDPSSSQAVHYTVPPLPQHGGLDAVSFWHGMTLIAASAPGNTGGKAAPANYPAVYVVSLNSSTHSISVRSLFSDEATATKVNTGQTGTTRLALTEPDSNEAIPPTAQRFGGQFVLGSQGDDEQIFVADPSGHQLSVLKLSQAIDDSVWPSGPSGALYVADPSADLIYKITGPFQAGSEIAAVNPCNANNAPSNCPGPGFPNNYLGQVDQNTGAISKVPFGKGIQPKGLVFVP